MTRQEHLDWCKKRALEYLDSGDVSNAVTSMLSDLNKHEGTEISHNGVLSTLGMKAVMSGDAGEARRFIEGFN